MGRAIVNIEIGQKFGKLTVVDKFKHSLTKKTRFICKCECGGETTTYGYSLRVGKTKSCGCQRIESGRKRVKNISGQKFGNITAIKHNGRYISPKGKVQTLWLCKCSCGTEFTTTYGKVKYGSRKSCPKCSKLRTGNRTTGKNNKKWSGYEGISGSLWNRIKKTAMARQKQFDVSIEYAWGVYIKQNGKCALTGMELYLAKTIKELKCQKNTASLDRIDSTKAYIEGNIQWVHKDINCMKWDYDQKYFIKMCKLVANNNS